jgi:hypothetical protein
MSSNAIKPRGNPRPIEAMTDREIWRGYYDELRKQVEAEMGALEDQFRLREQGVPMSPGTLRKMIRRRRELREAMEVFRPHPNPTAPGRGW